MLYARWVLDTRYKFWTFDNIFFKLKSTVLPIVSVPACEVKLISYLLENKGTSIIKFMLLSFILLVRNELSHQVVPDKKSIELRGDKGMVPGNKVHTSTAPCQTPHLVVLQSTVDGADTRRSCCVECYGCLKGMVRINSSPDEYILYTTTTYFL